MSKNPHAQALGRLGGQAKSAKKTKAAQRNAVISAYVRKKRKQADKPASEATVPSSKLSA